MPYRVVYGETMPAWEKIFATLREAKAYAKEHESYGDIIFSVKKVVPGEGPQSLMAKLEEDRLSRQDFPRRGGAS
jgi:hypothetical protein